MSALTTTRPLPSVDLAVRGGWRATKNRIATGLLLASVLVVVVPLVLVIGTVIIRGAKVMGLGFLTGEIAATEQRAKGGVGPAIAGTLVVTFFAALLAVPLGLLGAIYLHEYGGRGLLARSVRFMATVMTGVPSVVMGLFVYVVWTLRFKQAGVGGALALACLMLPIVIRTTEEMLRLVPRELREGALALGTSKSRTILTVVLPAALPGIMSGVLLAVARATGETAPLLFTIGAARQVNWNVFSGANTALPYQIFTNANSAFANAQSRGWGAALTLVAIAFAFTLVARIVSARFALKR
jgi:phosphate transport system permease protein